MTKLFIKQSNSSPLRDPSTDITLMLDSQTKEILKYQSAVQENKKIMKSIKLNDEHIAFAKSFACPKDKQNGLKCNNFYPKSISMELRHDLADCEIAICSQEILDHFNDNFDKSTLKDGLINWLYESEIIEDRVRAFEVKQQGAYMARICDPRLYGIVTQDILQRKAFPFTIDKKSIDSKSNYQYKMLSTYIDKSASIAISSHVSNNSVVGLNTVIDANSTINSSVIGERCTIGKNVNIINSIIDKNVVVGDNCMISNAII